LKLNGTYQLLAYADDVNILGGSVRAIKKITETLLVASKEIGVKVNEIKPSTRSGLEIRLQDEIVIYRLNIDFLKGWKYSDIWEQPKQVKILSSKKLRAD